MTTWNLEGTKTHLLLCNGSSCLRKGGEEVTQAVRDEIRYWDWINKFIQHELVVMEDVKMLAWRLPIRREFGIAWIHLKWVVKWFGIYMNLVWNRTKSINL